MINLQVLLLSIERYNLSQEADIHQFRIFHHYYYYYLPLAFHCVPYMGKIDGKLDSYY